MQRGIHPRIADEHAHHQPQTGQARIIEQEGGERWVGDDGSIHILNRFEVHFILHR
jgi:hypothetical protein